MSKILLTVMRLADMTRVHPDQITEKCARCGHQVGVYPSGQRIIKLYPGRVELVCQVCHEPGNHVPLAPGADIEPFESKAKDNEGRKDN